MILGPWLVKIQQSLHPKAMRIMTQMIPPATENEIHKDTVDESEVEKLRLKIAVLEANLAHFAEEYQKLTEEPQQKLKNFQNLCDFMKSTLHAFPERWRENRLELRQQNTQQPSQNTKEDTPSSQPPPTNPIEAVDPTTRDKSIHSKKAFHMLARRFHPDLLPADKIQEREERHQAMSYINELVANGENDKLLALAAWVSQDKASDIIWTDLHILWVRQQYRDLRHHLYKLQQSHLYKLWEKTQRATIPLATCLLDWQTRMQQQQNVLRRKIYETAQQIETRIQKLKERRANYQSPSELRPRSLNHSKWLGQSSVVAAYVGPLRYYVTRIIKLAQEEPEKLWILLLAYIQQLEPLPLLELESFEQLEMRFHALQKMMPQHDKCWLSTLAEMVPIVGYGPYGHHKQLGCALQFLNMGWLEGVQSCLAHPKIKPHLRALLQILGECHWCKHCQKEQHTLPLLRLRGLETLHALLCANCHQTIKYYLLPKGIDIAKACNRLYQQEQYVYDIDFIFAQQNFVLQLSAQEYKYFCVRDIQILLAHILFQRYEWAISAENICLCHSQLIRIPPTTSLASAPPSPYYLVIKPGTSVYDEHHILDHLRHKVAQRWAKD
jgi:hypothetical protein